MWENTIVSVTRAMVERIHSVSDGTTLTDSGRKLAVSAFHAASFPDTQYHAVPCKLRVKWRTKTPGNWDKALSRYGDP